MENINYILAYKALTEYTDVIRAMMEQVAEEGEEVTYMNTDLYQALLNYVLTKYSGSEDKNIAEDIDYRISVTQKIKKDLEMISYMSEDTAIEVIKKVLDEFLDYIEFIFTKCEIIEEKRGKLNNQLLHFVGDFISDAGIVLEEVYNLDVLTVDVIKDNLAKNNPFSLGYDSKGYAPVHNIFLLLLIDMEKIYFLTFFNHIENVLTMYDTNVTLHGDSHYAISKDKIQSLHDYLGAIVETIMDDDDVKKDELREHITSNYSIQNLMRKDLFLFSELLGVKL